MKKTLIAMAIVLLAFVAFSGLVINKYLNHQKHVKEVVLLQNVWTLRRAIDFYANDKGKRPQSLDDLVSAGYPREIFPDPFTGSNQTWVIEREKTSSIPNAPSGIIDVRSAAAGADTNGKPYNRY